jgi:hypothetical protein
MEKASRPTGSQITRKPLGEGNGHQWYRPESNRPPATYLWNNVCQFEPGGNRSYAMSSEETEGSAPPNPPDWEPAVTPPSEGESMAGLEGEEGSEEEEAEGSDDGSDGTEATEGSAGSGDSEEGTPGSTEPPA